MSALARKALQGGVVLVFLLIFILANLSAYGGAAASSVLVIPLFLIFLALAVGALARAARAGAPRIQRPLNGQTAFPPPPPPDTILVVCPYCNTSQPFKEKCAHCGGPLPKPGLY
ncbi:MAG TPA: hypothetical protein VGS11_07970 [Candidatus Bathyarchaeia archaeon]|nr:hypothetical protein [Candidatus Bathyarchaeia archaeon]